MNREDVKIGMHVKLTKSYDSLIIGKVYKVLRPQVIGSPCFVLDHNGDQSFLAPFCDNFEPEDTINNSKISPKLIRRFPSGAVRSNSTGRPRPDWVSPYAIEAIGQHLAGNVNDFGAVNYFLGIPEEACLESLTRHYIELSEAMLITKDGKATKEAVTALAFNATALLHTIILKEKGLYKEVYDKTELVTVEEAKKGAKFTEK